jgi:hypothetical protein
MRKIQPGNAVWEEWRLVTEPTIEPDVPSLHDARGHWQFFGARGSPSLRALCLAFPDLLGKEVEGQRARRLVRIDVLTVHLAASDEERSPAAEHGPPAKGDRDIFRDDVASERLHRRSVHHRSPYPGLIRAGRETGVVSIASEDSRDGGDAQIRQSLQRRGVQYTGAPERRRTFRHDRRLDYTRGA